MGNTAPSGDMKAGDPDLEVIFPSPGNSFRWHRHDYPHPLARWNHHPEYELHLITASRGTMFVGDYISEFKAGNLVLLGPNIPHHWVSDAEFEQVKGRDVVVQFEPKMLGMGIEGAPVELNEIASLLERSRIGLIFTGKGVAEAASMLTQIGTRKGLGALTLLYDLLLHLTHKTSSKTLVSPTYAPVLDAHSSRWMQSVLDLTIKQLDRDLKMSSVAAHLGMSEPAFSKLFKRTTGLTFTEYLRKLRIGRACIMLSDSDLKITSIAADCGFRNLSNFNRYFLIELKMTPNKYRQATKRRAIQ
jgi:AraC-like DNA-binding protein